MSKPTNDVEGGEASDVNEGGNKQPHGEKIRGAK